MQISNEDIYPRHINWNTTNQHVADRMLTQGLLDSEIKLVV